MRIPHTCERVCIAQVDSKLTSFVTAMSEVAPVTDPIHGPDSIGVGESEISSLTDPSYGSGSRREADAGVGESAIVVADAVVVGVGVEGGGVSESDASDGSTQMLQFADDPRSAWVSDHGDGFPDNDDDSASSIGISGNNPSRGGCR